MLVELLDELCDLILNLKSLSALQVLLLVRREHHRVLLLGEEVEQVLAFRLGDLSALDLDRLVLLHSLHSLLLLHRRASFIFNDVLDFDHFKFDWLGLLIVVVDINVRNAF